MVTSNSDESSDSDAPEAGSPAPELLETEVEAEADPDGEVQGAAQGASVVLVEDDPVQRRLYETVLTRAGYDVSAFEGALELVGLLQSVQPPAVVVTDIQMPGLDGLAFAARLLADREWCKVPIVVMTAEPTRDRVTFTRRLEVPPEAFLVKPIQPGNLATTVAGVLGRDRPLYVLRSLQRERLALKHSIEVEQKLAERSAQASIKASLDCQLRLTEGRQELQELQRTRSTLQKSTNATAYEGEILRGMDVTARQLQEQADNYKRQSYAFEEERRDVLARVHTLVIKKNREIRALDERIKVLGEVIRLQRSGADTHGAKAA